MKENLESYWPVTCNSEKVKKTYVPINNTVIGFLDPTHYASNNPKGIYDVKNSRLTSSRILGLMNA